MANTSNDERDATHSDTESIAPSCPYLTPEGIARFPITSEGAQFSDDLSPTDPDTKVHMTYGEGGERFMKWFNNLAPNDTEPGMICGIKNLYEGPERCRCCINWVEEYPDDTKTSSDDQAQRYALVVRNKKNHSGTKPMRVDSIVVHSPLLKTILKEVFDGFEGITATLKTLTFQSPFAAFFYRWERFEKAAKHQDDKIALSHTQLLHEVLKEVLQETISTYHDLVAHQVMTFDFLWTIFVPGEHLFSVQDGQDVMVKLQASWSEESQFSVSCKFVDWDGYEFGFSSSSLSIQLFENTKPISQLEVYPAKFHPNFDETKKRLVDRGIQFEELKGYHFKAYNGLALRLNDRYDNMDDIFPRISRLSKITVRVIAINRSCS